MSEEIKARVLFVDDDPNILDSFRRTFRAHLDFDTADCGQTALVMLREQGPYAVVVSDQRMPQMTGIALLREVHKAFPDIVRIMLTGNADQQTAIEAVNNGHIHRFLTKPCPPATILNAVQEGLRIWTRQQTERELLEQTLAGSLRVMTEVLATIHPATADQNPRMLRMMRHVVKTLHLSNGWQYDIAAMLSQIGCIALDADLLARVNAGYELGKEDEGLFQAHPEVGARLIRHLPRLDTAAAMIALQFTPLGEKLDKPLADLSPAEIGGHILQVAVRVDQAMRRGSSYKAALETLKGRAAGVRQDVLSALHGLGLESVVLESKPVRMRDLRIGQLLADDIQASNGITLAVKGQVISDLMLERIRAFDRGVGLREPFLIMVPLADEQTGDLPADAGPGAKRD
jgi:CheY-like chemotaxis protein